MKTSILKFLCLDYKIYDLIPQILKKSQILIDKDISLFKEETNSTASLLEFTENSAVNSNSSENNNNFFKEEEEKNKESAFDELVSKHSPNKEENSNEKKKNEEIEKPKNFFKKLFTRSNKNDNNIKIEEKFSDILKEKRKSTEKLSLQNIANCLKNINHSQTLEINKDFIKHFEKENHNFKNQVKKSLIIKNILFV